MNKNESLNRLNKLLKDIDTLPKYKIDNNPEYDKLFRRIKKAIEKIFEPSTEYIKDLEEIKFEANPMAQAIDAQFKRNGEFNEFNKSIINIRGTLESFIEEVNDWEDTELDKIIEKLNGLKNKETLEVYLNQFKRFGANIDFDKWKRSVDNILIKICGEDHNRYKEFKRIEFLNYDRFMDGVEVPGDLEVFRKGLKESIGLLESVINEIEEGYIKIEALDAQNSQEANTKENIIMNKSKVFIVHGHDNEMKLEVARFIEKLDLEPIILHEQASQGNTIIEKIEEHTNVGFGIVLYSPCDLGGKDENDLRPRARQNVVFEHGYLIAKLKRKNVSALVKGTVETPGDISGVVYISMSGSWEVDIAKELSAAGYEIDFNKIFK